MLELHQISALDVERVLLEHTGISEAAVVGMPDPLYGEKIAAIVVSCTELTLADVQKFCELHLPKSSIPSELLTVQSIPRNALGKVNKAELREKLFPSVPTQ